MHRLLDVDLRLIRIFRAITEARGMAGAELVLNMSQSRISAGLAEARGAARRAPVLAGALGVFADRGGRRQCTRRRATSSRRWRGSRTMPGRCRPTRAPVLRIGAVGCRGDQPRIAAFGGLPRCSRRQMPMVTMDFSTAGPKDLEKSLIGGRPRPHHRARTRPPVRVRVRAAACREAITLLRRPTIRSRITCRRARRRRRRCQNTPSWRAGICTATISSASGIGVRRPRWRRWKRSSS